MIRIGLTGSIAMGKTTTAAMLRERGAPVFDSDAAVHKLYARDGAAVGPISKIAPEAVVDGAVDRARLKSLIRQDETLLARIEGVVHPLVGAARAAFEAAARRSGAAFVVFDIPLLFETGAEADLDAVIVVTASAEEQRRRALARPGMTVEMFERLLDKQTPDAEKRRRADYLVETGDGMTAAAAQVDAIIADLRRRAREHEEK